MVTSININDLLTSINSGGDVPMGIEMPQKMTNTQRKAWHEVMKIVKNRREQERLQEKI